MIYVWSTKSRDTKIHMAATVDADVTFCNVKIPDSAGINHEKPAGNRETCDKCLSRFE